MLERDALWAVSTPFQFMVLFAINNNALIVRTASDTLVAVNAPELNPALTLEVKALEERYGAKLKWLVGTDWHHLYCRDWLAAFPQATAVFPSGRAPRLHLGDAHFPHQVLDRTQPRIPGVDPNVLELVPWLGFEGPPFNRIAEETHRGEWSVWLRPWQTLFVFDVFLPSMQPPFIQRLMGARPYRPNFGQGMSGFRLLSPDAAIMSTARLASCAPLRRIVLSHGSFAPGPSTAMIEGVDVCGRILAEYVRDVPIGPIDKKSRI